MAIGLATGLAIGLGLVAALATAWARRVERNLAIFRLESSADGQAIDTLTRKVRSIESTISDLISELASG